MLIKLYFDVLCLLAHCISPQSNFLYARVVAHMFELLAQQFPVPTIKIHISQHKCTRETYQQFPTRVGD